jgi:hypothetical protein
VLLLDEVSDWRAKCAVACRGDGECDILSVDVCRVILTYVELRWALLVRWR